MLLAWLLTLHSWFRWGVVFATLATGARCAEGWTRRRRWTSRDGRLGRLWIGAVDIQIALGMLLYFTASPAGAIARQDLRFAWSDDSLRFFGILHPLSMLVAASIAHATWVWTRRAGEGDPVRFSRLGSGVLGAVVVMALAIPWPFLAYGRPLARLGFE